MNFFKKHNHQRARVTLGWEPKVVVSAQAASDMMTITEHFSTTEVAWFGTVTKDPAVELFTIERILVPHQDVDSSTAEVQAEDMAKFAMSILEEYGIETYNNLRLWGHSHHSMSVGPSATDIETVLALAELSEDYYVAVRTNCKGDIEFDVAYADGTLFQGAKYSIDAVPRDDALISMLDARVRRMTYSAPVYSKGKGKKGKENGKPAGPIVYKGQNIGDWPGAHGLPYGYRQWDDGDDDLSLLSDS